MDRQTMGLIMMDEKRAHFTPPWLAGWLAGWLAWPNPLLGPLGFFV
jgi:hypothetical protein